MPLVSTTALSHFLVSECSWDFLPPGLHLCLVLLEMPLPSTLPVYSLRLIPNVFCMKIFFIVMGLHQTPVAFRLIFCLKLCVQTPFPLPLAFDFILYIILSHLSPRHLAQNLVHNRQPINIC